MQFSRMPSATPFAPHRTALRLDPYWDGVWQLGSNAQWVSHEHIERMEAAGLAATRPRALRSQPADARTRVAGDWDVKLDLLGVLSSWRTVTAEQAAAFTGANALAAGHARAIGDLFALDVIDTGAIAAATGGPNSAHGRMYRPSASKAFDRLILPNLSYAEWVSVTGGTKWLSGGQYDRHNVLTSELALRVAEYLPVGTLLGERQSHVDTLAYTSVGLPAPPGRSQQTADAVIVRADGLRIAVETTASVDGASFTAKLERWARTLSRRPVEDTGLVVVFVVVDRASSDFEPGEFARDAQITTVRRKVARAVRLIPGTSQNRTADRMFVVDWRSWFPGRGEASDDFMTLRAQHPSPTGNGWVVADLLDEFDVPGPTRMADPTAVIRNASGMRCVPHQLRMTDRPQLHTLPLARAGFRAIPHVQWDRRTGAERLDVARPRGSVNRITVPERLRY